MSPGLIMPAVLKLLTLRLLLLLLMPLQWLRTSSSTHSRVIAL